MKNNLILVGFSGTGKSESGKIAARLLGLEYVDADQEIERRAGKAVHSIFAEDGEEAFRSLEREEVQRACSGLGRVISVGGGAFVDQLNQDTMLKCGLVVCLEANPETILGRLALRSKPGEIRPLLTSLDPLERIRSLKSARQHQYDKAHRKLLTDGLTEEQVARELARMWQDEVQRVSEGEGMNEEHVAATVTHSGGSYPVVVGSGVLSQLGTLLAEMGAVAPAYIISDENVFRTYGRQAQRSLEESGIAAHCYIIPPGEESKSLALAEDIYAWLAEVKAERGQTIVALGGGVVGDLGGFAAATFLRGMRFVQVPTSMAAMVDASIGGKVAVNLPQGKNLVGAFYQPSMVLADIDTLATLGQRELSEGWAEAIKHGLILDAELFDLFEEYAEELLSLNGGMATDVIKRSVAIKAQVVTDDERETLGRRILLNYGHTIGHALEAASGYGQYLHGEAVSVGMMGAIRISRELGMVPEELVTRQRRLLERFSLPTSASGVDHELILDIMTHDKKTESGFIKWVLLEGIGKSVVRRDVPPSLVEETVRELTR